MKNKNLDVEKSYPLHPHYISITSDSWEECQNGSCKNGLTHLTNDNKIL
jgi:hypothetical protein